MRKIKLLTTVAFTALAVIFTGKVNAQTVPAKAWRFNLGLDGGSPDGAISSISKFALGVTGQLQYGVSKKVALTLTSGYYNFFASRDIFQYNPIGLVPVKLGFKAFVTPGFYFSGEVGVGFETKNFGNIKNLYQGYPPSTKLIWSPGIGYATKSWDFGLRFENFAGQQRNYNMIALRIAHSIY